MTVTVEKSTARGKVTAPPSKSDAHRLLICAGLAKGISRIKNVAFSEDIRATIDCLSSLGAAIKIEGDSVITDGTDVSFDRERKLYCRESGSTLRFFIPLCLLGDKKAELYGSERLLSRPLSVYEDITKEQGITLARDDEKVTVKGKIRSGEFEVEGNISSQFISGLLFALPLADSDSRIHIKPPIESLPYIEMTLSTLKRFGVECTWETPDTLYIKGSQEYKPQETAVEGDWSNSAFLDAFNLVGGEVETEGLSSDSIQGDKIYRQYFEMIKNGTPTLDISDCPDLGPVLMALSAANHGARFTGTGRLRIKESDRGEAMKEELSKFGVKTTVSEDEITVEGGLHTPTEALCSHNDHRIVMSLTLLLSLTGGSIDGAEAVRKSYPDFFKEIEKLGIKIKLSGDKYEI